MGDIGIITLILIIVTGLVTYQGFKKRSYFNENAFVVDHILINKQYQRLITSGFLHVNWMHFGFNMVALYLFSLERSEGVGPFLFIYFGSLVGGNLFSLYIHKNHGDYSAVGASGAVSGLVFASIGLYPSIKIGLLLIPFHIPGWLFGILYVLYSIYGIKSQRDNIGHEAHLGGGIIGLLIALVIRPEMLPINYLPILGILVPSIAFLVLLVYRPHLLLVPSFKTASHKFQTLEDKYNEERKMKELKVDEILDKIRKKGINKLTQKEKDFLDSQ